ncbi:Fructoselysine kinase [Lacticaseibacillus paracasei subsp. paracasei Lpp229]|nr:Fructoselysine kinase [Lacticaseibacillus paracasei subsp. paracasei Lpp229]
MKVIAIGDNVVDLYPADKQMYLGGPCKRNTGGF